MELLSVLKSKDLAKMKKILLSFLLIISITYISACKSGSISVTATIPPYEVLAETIIDKPVTFSCVNDNIILVGKANLLDTYIYSFNSQGELLTEAKIDSAMMFGFSAADIDNDNNVWLFHRNIMTASPLDAETLESATVDCFDVTGNLIGTVELDVSEIKNVSDFIRSNKLLVDDNGFYLYKSYDLLRSFDAFSKNYIVLYAFDRNGKLIAETQDYRHNKLIEVLRLSSGQTVAQVFNPQNSSFLFMELDFSKKDDLMVWELSDEVKSGAYFTTGAGDMALLRFTEKAVFSYDIENGKSIPLVDWEKRRIDNAVRGAVTAVDSEYVFSLMKNTEDDTLALIRLAATDDEALVYPAVNKKTVIVAGFNLWDGQIKKAIDEFNALSAEYRIMLKDYYQGNFDDALINLNLDITSGNMPDIIVFSDFYQLPRDSYVKKGLFADLYEFIDNDPDMKRDDYLPNALEALETDGKLYFGATSFNTHVLIGKKSVVGEKMGWTWNEYNELISKQPSGTIPFAYAYDTEIGVSPKHIILRVAAHPLMADFIDEKNATCDFITSNFTNLLEMINDFPQDVGDLRTSDFSNGNPLLMDGSMSNFYDLKKWENEYFKEEITFIGFPDDGGGSGAYGTLYNPFAISAKSEVKDGAWAFAKYLLTDCQEMSGPTINLPDYKFIFGFMGYPIKISELHRIAEISKVSPSDNGYRVYNEVNYSSDGYYVNDDKDIKKILDFINSVKFTNFDAKIQDIISEESEGFLAGQKTAEEVAEIIQNRVNLYLAERN